MEKTAETDAYWNEAKASGTWIGEVYWVRRIGANKPIVDSILDLILSGEKCGTFGLKLLLDRQPGSFPTMGGEAVIVDMDGVPHGIVRTSKLTPVAYKDITEDYLTIEGPGARQLDRWQEIHWPYWSALLDRHDLDPSDDMVVMVEHFELVYSKTPS